MFAMQVTAFQTALAVAIVAAVAALVGAIPVTGLALGVTPGP